MRIDTIEEEQRRRVRNITSLLRYLVRVYVSGLSIKRDRKANKYHAGILIRPPDRGDFVRYLSARKCTDRWCSHITNQTIITFLSSMGHY